MPLLICGLIAFMTDNCIFSKYVVVMLQEKKVAPPLCSHLPLPKNYEHHPIPCKKEPKTKIQSVVEE